MAFFQFMLGLVPSALTYFKVNPRRAAHIIVIAIGYLTVATGIIEQVILPVMYKATDLLRQVLATISVN